MCVSRFLYDTYTPYNCDFIKVTMLFFYFFYFLFGEVLMQKQLVKKAFDSNLTSNSFNNQLIELFTHTGSRLSNVKFKFFPFYIIIKLISSGFGLLIRQIKNFKNTALGFRNCEQNFLLFYRLLGNNI